MFDVTTRTHITTEGLLPHRIILTSSDPIWPYSIQVDRSLTTVKRHVMRKDTTFPSHVK